MTAPITLEDRERWRKNHTNKLAIRKMNRKMVNGRLTSTMLQEHGTPSGYNNWFCRCIPCTQAYNGRKKDNRKKRRR
ncbi:gp061 [Rhodococcus phage ReqiPepy6]|uniref:Gp061 n=1 Tax=Rhodococcus phage ReqiPepy6 TaxID=691965 RepID=D4P7H2_9CAUD|nr:gp061 [Rhodococcus phage ReqiPepy6]ADD80952.1 gp061 [Rhodococcus phage ReqiPepy6]